MKKILSAFLIMCLALVLGYGVAVYWVGGQARNQYDLMLAQINRSNCIEVSNKSYERGLFSSRALTSVVFTQPGGGDSIKFIIVNSIHHGPVVFLRNPHLKGGLQVVLTVIQTQLSPDDCAEGLKKLLEKVPELRSSEIMTAISLDGSAESYCDVPAFEKTLTNDKSEEIVVQWGGLGANFIFNALLGEASGSYSAPSLQVTEKNDLLRVKNIQGDMNSHIGIKGIAVGSMAFSAESVEAFEQGESSLNLTGLGVQAESGFSGETVSGSIRIAFDKLNAGGLGLGPLVIELEARKLDADVLSRFEHMMPELQKNASGGAADVDNDKAMHLFLNKMLVDLLAKSPEFELKQLKIRTDKGDLSGSAKVVFSDLGENLAGNILALLGSIDANAELSVSEALFFFLAENALRDGSTPDSGRAANKGAGEIAKGLLAQNIMVRDNGAFKSSAAYKHGRLSVNGRKMDLSGLLGSRPAQ
jgi:uncharacterized protein YdgA (DUF945 family)